MSIILAVVLAYTIIGGAVAHWLEIVRFPCTVRQAWVVFALCGPVCWLLVGILFTTSYIRSR